MKTTFQALLGITTRAFAGQAAAQATFCGNLKGRSFSALQRVPDFQRNQFNDLASSKDLT
jgi:hypothetical protein